MTSHTHFQNELSKLSKNIYFDQARISRVKSLSADFNFEFKQIITAKKSIKCYVLSDIHADAEKNQVWMREKCVRSAEDTASDAFTVFIVPGDIGSEIDRIEAVLRNLVSNYDAVCFLPGNHEAWRKGTAAAPVGCTALAGDPICKRPDNRMATDSVAKLVEVLERARVCGVHVGPLRVQLATGVEDAPPPAVLVMPLHGWYHSSWDSDADITDADFLAVEAAVPFSRKWGDYAMCAWPEEIISHRDFVSNPSGNTVLAEVFAKLNEPFLHPPPEQSSAETESASEHPEAYFGSPLAQPSDTVISFSHYLPRLELCPEKRFLTEPMLTKVIGSDVLESQVRRLQPHLHLYGHTHIPLDLELEGIRYLQWPLGYFREAHLQCAPIFSSGPLAVYDSALGSGNAGIPEKLASESTAWSKHYRKEARDPSKVNELAPWVRARLAAYSGMC